MIRRITTRFIGWCEENSLAARLERTIVQGIIAVLIVGITTQEWSTTLATGIIMAILSPLQKAIGNKGLVDEEEIDSATNEE